MTTLIFARTIYGEARGESLVGKVAVGCVIMNRVKKGGWWGDTIEDVCLKKFQFSCWNSDDPNLEKIKSVSELDPVFVECCTIAALAADELLVDRTYNATHYHTKGIRPGWVSGHESVYETGAHIFYNDVK
jgi:N-acetylmuramoyl-L-alanine amidase